MPRKRPTESSWDSDEELLGDTSSVSAFSSKKGGEDEIDEDALLGFGDDGMQEYSEGGEYSFATSEIDIGLDSSTGLDSTAGSQCLQPDQNIKCHELDYEDVPEETAEEFVLEEVTDVDIEDPLMVGEQPNDTTCAVESTQPTEIAEEDSDDEGGKRDRGRFQTERKSTNITSSSKGSAIPDSLEITKEMQEEIDTFEKQKGKFNKRGGGRQQNRGQNRNTRGQGQMRGHNMAHRMQRPVGRLMGPRGTGPNRLRGPQGFQRPMGLPMRQNSQGMPRPQMFRPQGPNQNMNRGPVPRFSNEIIRAPNQGPRPDHTPRKPIPQPFISSQPMPLQTMYTEQHQFTQPVPSHSQSQPQLVHSQPHVMHSQPTGSTIHVNPKFHGGLQTSVQQSTQHSVLPHSVPQPLFSQQQPIQSYQNSPQAWGNHPGQQPSMHSSAPGSYPQSQQMYPPQPQPVPLLPEHQNRPGILGSHPAGLMQAPDHQHHQEHNMHPQNAHQIQPRPLLQPQQHPNQHHSNVRNTGPINNFNQHGPRNPLGGPHQVRPQRPMANQNVRGSRPANQMTGNVRPMRPAGGQNFKSRNPQTNQRFKVPEKSGPIQNVKQNATSGQLAGPAKVEVDPEKEKKLKEMEEKKRLRAERFKMNTPVQVNAGSPSNKKIIATKAGKRPSGEEPSKDEISPAKTIKIETLATMKTDSSAMNSEDALKKALEEQKKRRELIMKIKEAKRQAVAEQKRKALAEKLAKEGQSSTDLPMETQQGSQAHQQHQHQQQFNTQNRGRGRGQKFNRGGGQGQGHVNMSGQGQGQPISVLGQKQPNLVQVPIEVDQTRALGFNQGPSRGQGQARGRGFVKGQGHSRGRGVQSAPNIVNLQQVEIQESTFYDNGLNRSVNEPSNNRTVLTNSTTRQVIGMNARGAASQAISTQGREVIEENSAPRRIVLNSHEPLQSSTVLIKDLPAKVDLGKINKKCAQHGSIKSFNYKADAKQIIVQYHSPVEAAAFLKKNPKFMIDMAYLTSSSLPDGTD